MAHSEEAVKVGIIMGSQSDWPTLRAASAILDELKVPHEAKIVSAHRTPDRLWDYGKSAVSRGLKVIIAGAGGAALEGMATQMLQLARLSGTEVGPLIASTAKAFAGWGVATADQGAALDHLPRRE